MASPQESITTVNGRRCTRSRARTAATSTSTPAAAPTSAAPTEPTTTSATQAPPTQQTAAAGPQPSQQQEQPAPPPPPPPPPPASSVVQSAVVSLPTSQAAASSAAGTGSVLVSLATAPLPAILQPSAQAPQAAIPSASSQPNDPVEPSSQSAAVPSDPTTRVAPTSSDITETAVIESPTSSPPLPPSTTPAVAAPVVTKSVDVTNPTSVTAVPDIIQSALSSETLSPATSIAELLSQTTAAATSNPTRDPLGIIAPERGSHNSESDHNGDGHSTHNSNHSSDGPKIGGIVGGAVGGIVGLALLGALLFFCLRRRKSKEGNWHEKQEESSGFTSTLKAVPASFFARLRNEKTGPLNNPYQRHQPRSSVSSVYSTTSSGRGRSISEPQGQAAPGGGFVRRMSSKKSERNVLRKKTSSVSSQTPFTGITEEPARNSNINNSNNVGYDPFADSAQVPARNLRISNPDAPVERTRGLSPPRPAATPRVVRDPFASLIDEIDGAPDWLRDSKMTAGSASNHRRTQSTASALPSHPASSIYSIDPFADPSPIPALPSQTSTAQQSQPPMNTYSAFPSTRESNFTFFGEPGPSRPGTTVFAPGLPTNPSASRRPSNNFTSTRAFTPGPLTGGLPTSTSRLDRQSDPFDLDRPEVLSFKGIMNQMRDSIARTATVRSRRTSSVGGWFGREASPAPPPPLNGPSVRR